MKILIAGGPRTGKSTLAKRLSEENGNIPVRCTDDVIHTLPWATASLEVATWFDAPGPWIIEGTIVVRAMRKWFFQSPTQTQCAKYVYFGSMAFIPTTSDQNRMIIGCNTIWNYVGAEAVRRGMVVRHINRVITTP